jgi:hypothetical protein
MVGQELYGMCANNFQDVSLTILLLHVHFHFFCILVSFF